MRFIQHAANFVKDHPFMFLGLTCLSVLSAILGIFADYQNFYEKILSKNLTLPVWTIFVLFILVAIGVITSVIKLTQQRIVFKDVSNEELEIIIGQRFGVEQVVLDGKRFQQCIFDGSELVFHGRQRFALESNHFLSFPRLNFRDEAGLTLITIKSLLESDPFRSIILDTFEFRAP